MHYYNEKEYFEAVKEYGEAESEANKIKREVFSPIRGQLPRRSMTEEDIAIIQKSHDKWERVLKIARMPFNTEV